MEEVVSNQEGLERVDPVGGTLTMTHCCLNCLHGKSSLIHKSCYEGGKWRKHIPKREWGMENKCEKFEPIIGPQVLYPIDDSGKILVSSVEEIFSCQRELMKRVPHEIDGHKSLLMRDTLKVIDRLLRFLGSHGHKPWRPIPLSYKERLEKRAELRMSLNVLDSHSEAEEGSLNYSKDFSPEEKASMLTSLGIIEEALEALFENQKEEVDRAKLLEEDTDILFFLIEKFIQDRFTWEEIHQQYLRKWKINIKRYEDGAKGDYSWDNRLHGKKEL